MTRPVVILARAGRSLVGVQTPRGAYEVIDEGEPRTIRSSRRVVALNTTLKASGASVAHALAERLRLDLGDALLETLWSLCDGGTQSARGLLELIGGDWTLGEDELRLALAADTERFVLDLGGVQPRSAAERSARAERAAAQQALTEATAAWRERLQRWPDTDDAAVTEMLRRALAGEDVAAAAKTALAGEAASDDAVREAAGALLVGRGLLDAIGDVALATTALDTDTPGGPVRDTPALVLDAADDRGWWTIDGAGAEELDDALWARRHGADVMLGVAIAAPGLFVDHDSDTDRDARARGSTLYHPRRSSGIWPPRLATDIASLTAGSERPALLATLRIAPDGSWTSELSAGRVAIERSWTYAAFDAALRQPEELAGSARAAAQVEALGEAAIRIRLGRLRAGGWAAMQPQTDVRARGRPGDVQLRDTSPYHPARAVVGEAMLAAGMAFAAFAEGEGIAVPWRVQRWRRETPGVQPEPGQRLHDPATVGALLGRVARTEVGFEPGPHALIGAAGYVQATSPLRRYGDVLVHRRLFARLLGQADPLDDAAMQTALREAEQAGRERMRFGRQAARAYKLAWLERALQRRPEPQPRVYAQVVRLRDDGRADVALPGLGLTTRCKLAAPAAPGDWWAVACVDITASRGRLVVTPRARVEPPMLGPGIPLEAARWVAVAPEGTPD